MFFLLLLTIPTQFQDYNPPGSVSNQGIFTEVLSRCPLDKRQTQARWCRSTHCHELVHFINNDLWNKTKRDCFYVQGGKFVQFSSTPRITLTDVASQVYQRDRNDTYQLYLVQLAGVNNKLPYQILDEWSAFKLDAALCREEGLPMLCADVYEKRFHALGDALVRTVKLKDPNYPDLKKLIDFVEYIKRN